MGGDACRILKPIFCTTYHVIPNTYLLSITWYVIDIGFPKTSKAGNSKPTIYDPKM